KNHLIPEPPSHFSSRLLPLSFFVFSPVRRRCSPLITASERLYPHLPMETTAWPKGTESVRSSTGSTRNSTAASRPVRSSSSPVLEVMGGFENPREDLFQLCEWVRDLGATTILISEMKPNSEDFGRHGEEYICDGIIHAKMERVDDANIQRRIRCVKMRGTNHSPNYFTLLFQNGIFQATRIIAE